MEPQTKPSRRDFIKSISFASAAVTLGGLGFSAKSYGRILGANEQIQTAVIGCKRRGIPLSESIAKASEMAHLVTACDIYQPQREELASQYQELTGERLKLEEDLRKVLDDRDIDAVFVAIPDHWHVPAAILALKAGKHVYVEKPCSHNPSENELIVACQKKYNKIVQMGTQQRSAPESIDVIDQIHSGEIGEVYLAVAFYSNSRGSIGNGKVVPVPEGFNWELFQGPAPRTVYKDIYFDYNWHWFWNWGTGETGNNAVHELDIARWALQVDYPDRVVVNAGKYHFKDDDWVMYDTMDATFHFGNKTIKWDGKSRNGYNTYGGDRGTIIYGSEGSVYVDRNRYRLYNREGRLVREATAAERSSTIALGGGDNMTDMHVANFFAAIKGTEKPNAPIDAGAKSTLLGHLANIAYRTGQPLECTYQDGHIKNQEAMKLWGREYEPGWEPEV
ncbi:Gfo/Idh/MocA family oxidoreductase [bacterium]|nr:Gfo/Idh/MocA family oxidoreductase [bacterium]